MLSGHEGRSFFHAGWSDRLSPAVNRHPACGRPPAFRREQQAVDYLVSHCTGFEASRMLAEALNDRFFLNNAGSVCLID
jgi:hypothetical protein